MWQWFDMDLDLKLDVDEKSDVFLPNELNQLVCFLVDLIVYSSVLYTKIVCVFLLKLIFLPFLLSSSFLSPLPQ